MSDTDNEDISLNEDPIAAYRDALRSLGISPAATTVFLSRAFPTLDSLIRCPSNQILRIIENLNKSTNSVFSATFSNRVKATVWWGKRQAYLGRPLTPADISPDEADRWSDIMQTEELGIEAAGDPIEPKPFKSASSWITFSSALDSHLYQLLGGLKSPLSYVIREADEPTEPVPENDEDGEPLPVSERERLRLLTPHSGAFWQDDNARVYNILLQLTADHKAAHSKVKSYNRSKNGRKAWKALKSEYEGTSNNNRQVTTLNTALDSLRYDGKSSRVTLDNHIARMRDIFTELDDINTKNANPDEQVNFSNRQKIDKLLKSIHVEHLNQVKDTIRLNPDRYRTFEEAVNDITLLHDEHRQERNKLKRTIAESGTRRPGGGRTKRGRVDKSRSKDWIPKEKWAKMSEAEKKAHLLKVKKKKVEEDKRKIAELESEVQEPSTDAAAGDTAGNEDEDDSNRRGTGSPHGRGGRRS